MRNFVFSCCFGLVLFLNGLYSEEVEPFYNISIRDREDSFTIRFQTTAVYNKARYLRTDALDLQLPEGSEPGVISAQFEVDTSAPSLNVVGPSQGALEFIKGISLPKISLGKYTLILDSRVYGTLQVTEKGVFFKSFLEH